MTSVKERIEMALAEAEWCDSCEEDFTELNWKVAPDATEVFMTREARVICQDCEDRRQDQWSESQIG
jgi:hypothetical protein